MMVCVRSCNSEAKLDSHLRPERRSIVMSLAQICLVLAASEKIEDRRRDNRTNRARDPESHYKRKGCVIYK